MKNRNNQLLYRRMGDGDGCQWNYATGLDEMRSTGSYLLQLRHGSAANGLPLPACINDHYIEATLIVAESGTDDRLQKNRLIGQTLIMPQCSDGKTHIFTRTLNCAANSWQPWAKMQQNEQVGQVTSLDAFCGSGLYSGVYSNGASNEAFLLVVIDNSETTCTAGSVHSVSQFKYALNVDGTFSYKTRTGRGSTDIEWGNWVDLGAADTTDIQDNSITAQKLSAALLEQINQNTANATKAANGAYWTSGPNAVTLNINKNDGTVGWQTLPAATTENAGVMSAGDKKALYGISNREYRVEAIFDLQEYTEGYVKTGDAGTVVTDFSTHTPSYWRSCIVQVKPNDTFYIQGKGGGGARLWAFLDENNTVISSSAESVVSAGENLVAPDGAVLLVANFEVSVAYKLRFIPEYVAETDNRLHVVESGLADLATDIKTTIPEPTGVGYLLTNVGIGNVVDLDVDSTSTDWRYYIIPVPEYTIFEMTNCRGGNNSRLWAFVDSSYRLLSISDANATIDTTAVTVPAPQNAAFLIINNNVFNKPNPKFRLYQEGNLEQRVENLESSVGALVNGYGKTKNILVFGNSYSFRSVAQGAGNILNMAASIGAPIFVEVIGNSGASFESNYTKYLNDETNEYRWEGDTQSGIADRANEGLTFKEALSLKEWDYIIFHQASKYSGNIESFSPYLQNLIDAAKTYCKNENVKIGLMQTWAYANIESSLYPTTNTTVPVFTDQMGMYEAISQTYQEALKSFEDVAFLIPCGTALQNARLTELGQNYNDFGASSTDGSHINSVGTLITSLCVFNKVFAAENNIKLSEISNYCNLLSDDEFEIAKECVRNAIKFPFENKSIVV